MILAGSFHGNLVLPSTQAIKRSVKTPLIFIVHEHVDMSDLLILGDLVFQLKAVADLIPVLGRRYRNLLPVLSRLLRRENWRSTEIAH